jgi:hypothetical protein
MRSAVDWSDDILTHCIKSDKFIYYDEKAEKIIKEIQREALEHAAKIADHYGKCVCPEYYTNIGKHEPNAAHLDCEEIALAIRAEKEKI